MGKWRGGGARKKKRAHEEKGHARLQQRARACWVAAGEARFRSHGKNRRASRPRTPTPVTHVIVPHLAPVAVVPHHVSSPSTPFRPSPPTIAEALTYRPPTRPTLVPSSHYLHPLCPRLWPLVLHRRVGSGFSTLLNCRCAGGVTFRCGYPPPTSPACDFSGAQEWEARSYG